MKLIIGGCAQGKLEYALQKYSESGAEEAAVYDSELPDDIRDKNITIVINHFHLWVRSRMSGGGSPEKEIFEFLEKYPDCIIISDEIGNGIVPAEKFEREYRERTGRLLTRLAREACEVERVICGIGQKIK